MLLPDAKKLAQLAKACRKAGITHFKCAEFEFTLEQEKQLKVVKSASKQTAETLDPVSEDMIGPEALLFWSSQEIPVPQDKEAVA